MELKLTEYEEKLFNDWALNAEYMRMGAKTTVCLLTLKNGFEIVGTSACVDPNMFDKEIGEHYALKQALDKLDELQGFYRQAGDFRNGITITHKADIDCHMLDAISGQVMDRIERLLRQQPLGRVFA